MADGSAPAGWYPDGRGNQRWWDGERWTEQRAPEQPAREPDSKRNFTRVWKVTLGAVLMLLAVIGAFTTITRLMNSAGPVDGYEAAGSLAFPVAVAALGLWLFKSAMSK